MVERHCPGHTQSQHWAQSCVSEGKCLISWLEFPCSHRQEPAHQFSRLNGCRRRRAGEQQPLLEAMRKAWARPSKALAFDVRWRLQVCRLLRGAASRKMARHKISNPRHRIEDSCKTIWNLLPLSYTRPGSFPGMVVKQSLTRQADVSETLHLISACVS